MRWRPVRLLQSAVEQAGLLLAGILSALHHGSVSVINYPDAVKVFSSVTWQVETVEGRQFQLDREPLDPRNFLDPEYVRIQTNLRPWLFKPFEDRPDLGS